MTMTRQAQLDGNSIWRKPVRELILNLVYDGPNSGPISVNISVRFDLVQPNHQVVDQMDLFLKCPFQSTKMADDQSSMVAVQSKMADNGAAPESKMAADTSATPESHVKLFAVELQFYAVLVPDMQGNGLFCVQNLGSLVYSNLQIRFFENEIEKCVWKVICLFAIFHGAVQILKQLRVRNTWTWSLNTNNEVRKFVKT